MSAEWTPEWIKWLPILIAVLAIIQAILAYASLRPYLVLRNVKMSDFTEGKDPVIIVEFENSGKTNARDVFINVTVQLLEEGREPNICEEWTHNRGTVGSGQITYYYKSLGIHLNRPIINNIESGHLNLFVLGFVSYTGPLLYRCEREEFSRQYLTWKGGFHGRPKEVPRFASRITPGTDS